MSPRSCLAASALVAALAMATPPASADVFFSTGDPDGLMATASAGQASSAGKIEIESADDFVATSPTSLTSATFTGLLPTGLPLSEISQVRVEIYRVFPNDSDVGRTPQVTYAGELPFRRRVRRSGTAPARAASPSRRGVVNPLLHRRQLFLVVNGDPSATELSKTGGEGPVTGARRLRST